MRHSSPSNFPTVALNGVRLRVAKELDYTVMRLDTGRNHEEALRLYKSLGFQEIPPYYEAPPELRNHLIFMSAALTR